MANILLNVAHHGPGPVALAFSPDGKLLYTGGGDCVARVWNMEEEKDPEIAALNESDEALSSVAATDTMWITASQDSSVRKYSVATNRFQDLIMSGNAVARRCVALDPNKPRIAVASDDLDVKIIDLDDITKVQTLTGHKNGVRKATWHPSSSFLTTCGQDGRILVWDTSGDNAILVKTIDGLVPYADPEASSFSNDCSAVWHPSGKVFFVATRTHEIVAVSRDTWAKSGTLPSSDEISSEITALAISPNGLYLASASKDGVLIWSTQIRRVMFRHQIDSQTHINQLLFSPTQNILVWGDTQGNLYRWVNPIPDGQPAPFVERTAKQVRREKTPMFGDMEEDFGEDLEEDWIIDDMAGAGGVTTETSRDKEKSYAREIVSVTKAQLAFQPGATPLRDRKGYLAYNSIGVIEVTDQDAHQIINVEFHDRSTYNSHHFTDHSHFTLASLGTRGIAYARPSEKSEPSQLMYQPYSTWGSAGEWKIELPHGEDIIAIAAGGIPGRYSYKQRGSEEQTEDDGAGHVVAATSRGYLRFFKGSGIQTYIWAMGGDLVSLVAGDEWVFVVHREGGTSLDGCQNLRYSIISLDRFEAVQDGQLPLPKGKTLKWIGISQEGAPAIYDSTGVLFVLDRFRRPRQGRWVPLLDTNTLARRVGKEETYWPIGLSGTTFMCLILKGRAEYPGFPRPLVQEIELQIPLLSTEQPQTVTSEEKLVREGILLGWMRDTLGRELASEEIAEKEVAMDKDIIKLLQLAIKDRHLQRANDLVHLLNQINSLDTAAKLAEYYHLVGLVDKIKTWKAWREENEDPVDEMNERRAWARGVGPIPPSGDVLGHLLGNRMGGAPQDFRPPPILPKRSLANAIPSYSHNVFAKKPDQSNPFARLEKTRTNSGDLDSSQYNANDQDTGRAASSSPPVENKRKRIDEDEEMTSAPKKQKTGTQGTSAASNSADAPMSRKLASAVPSNAKPNPFARTRVSNQSIAKSGSFFEKVDAAEAAGPSKSGSKGDKKAPKQTTLFGLPKPVTTEKNVTKPKKASPNEADTSNVQPLETEDGAPEETQLVEEPEETQDAGHMEDDEEPIEWPDSPPRESS